MANEIYVPKKHRIALCLGVEGVWNDGVYECFAATITAMQDMPQYKGLLADYGLTEKLHPKKWRELKDSNFKESPELGKLWKLFRAQRPVVKVAEDYLYNVLIAHHNPALIEGFLAEPDNPGAYEPFFNGFEETAAESIKDGKQLGNLFYNKEKCTGRRWLQEQDPFGWEDLNEPMGDALREMRKIVDASKKYGGENGGYDVWFVTTKGEGDSFSLCSAYRRLGLLGEDEYSETGARACIISRKRIVGRETLEQIKKQVMAQKGLKKTDKEFESWFKANVTSYQLDVVKKEMGVPFSQIVKLDDRVDEKGLQQIHRKHAREVIIPWGYSFGWQIEEARNNPFVDVVSENMAADISKLVVETWGFD